MAVLNYSQQDNMAATDVIINNSRMRATVTNPQGQNWMAGFGTPISIAPGATSQLTTAQLLTGIVTIAPTQACTVTFPTAANMVAAFAANSSGAQVGDVLECLIMNGTASTTITLASTNVSYDTNQANTTIAGATSKYVLIRLTNVTSGSEAYTVYF
jgi:hypothetical protein